MAHPIPPVPPRLLQVIVEPSQEDLIRRQPQQIVDGFPILTKTVQLGVQLDVDLRKQAAADNLPDQTEDQMFGASSDI